jgi:multidrug efflux pump
VFRWSERAFEALLGVYERSLGWALEHSRLMIMILIGTVCFNGYLFWVIPKGFLPQQDTGRMIGGIQADQSISFQLMQQKLVTFINMVKQDPAIDTVVGFTGGSRTNSGFVFASLKPLSQRDLSVDRVIARLRARLSGVPGATLFFQPVQDVRVGGRQSNALYQYTLQGDNLADLRTWTPKIAEALQHVPELSDVNSDLEEKGLETDLVIDRETSGRLGITASQIDNTLYDAFGQRQVSTIYNPLNQYHVVMEVAPQFWQSPDMLSEIWVSTSGNVTGTQSTNAVAGTTVLTKPTQSAATSSAASVANDAARNQAANGLANTSRGSTSAGSAVSTASEKMVPLSAFTHFGPGSTPLAVNHQGHFVAATISFNLTPGSTLGGAVTVINQTMNQLGVPATIQGTFQGTAQVFQQSLANQPILIMTALLAVYIVLGMLYESYIHPITILSTLPSAGVGAALALMAFNTEFTLIALIGVILLIGIVKKNAIMMIDFALDAERTRGLDSRAAIYEACLRRFRPIMMTTVAAMLGALPLALGAGDGAELRRPLGISIVGGLIVSQMLTLYTTPVVYLYLDRFSLWIGRRRSGHSVLEGA